MSKHSLGTPRRAADLGMVGCGIPPTSSRATTRHPGRRPGSELSVLVRTLPSMGRDLATVVEHVERASVGAAEHSLLSQGACPPPTVHLLSRHLVSPYVGSVATRRFRRGADAAAAVRGLGLLPSVLFATELVVVWEHADLCAALGVPGEVPTGLVVARAGMWEGEHELRWHPFAADPGAPARPGGPPTLVPRWGQVVQHEGAELPWPVTDLLGLWREFRRGDIAETRAGAVAGTLHCGPWVPWVRAQLVVAHVALWLIVYLVIATVVRELVQG
jgi:hypothetical protein